MRPGRRRLLVHVGIGYRMPLARKRVEFHTFYPLSLECNHSRRERIGSDTTCNAR